MSVLSDNKGDPQDGSKGKRLVSIENETRQNPYGSSGWAKPEARLSRMTGPTQQRSSETEYESAFRLVQKASEAIDTLQERCRRLEVSVRETNDRIKSEAETSERVIKDWENLAGALKAQLSKTEAGLAEAQQKLKAMEDRATAAETRAQSSEARAEANEIRAQEAERYAAQEIELASSFRHTILETFGSGSRLSSALAGESSY